MRNYIHFYVYEYAFLLKDNRKVTRYFITIRDGGRNIIAFTDF